MSDRMIQWIATAKDGEAMWRCACHTPDEVTAAHDMYPEVWGKPIAVQDSVVVSAHADKVDALVSARRGFTYTSQYLDDPPTTVSSISGDAPLDQAAIDRLAEELRSLGKATAPAVDYNTLTRWLINNHRESKQDLAERILKDFDVLQKEET